MKGVDNTALDPVSSLQVGEPGHKLGGRVSELSCLSHHSHQACFPARLEAGSNLTEGTPDLYSPRSVADQGLRRGGLESGVAIGPLALCEGDVLGVLSDAAAIGDPETWRPEIAALKSRRARAASSS
eukprot:CAMPEP_0172646496 /NCGR_PEP_ID=MMETSP1068-20121228/240274_1 /TAXON_ID=35684 /ORGANISM="Pseudopedinella elastica, Strain CCMP716" /LENGTH=126 /DNA_ID=CAMNT_0013460761 /DNA_START=1500 /DNA_END=1878 /DNA_ORIENTATION=+